MIISVKAVGDSIKNAGSGDVAVYVGGTLVGTIPAGRSRSFAYDSDGKIVGLARIAFAARMRELVARLGR